MGGRGKQEDWREREALFRYGLIREAADERRSPRERGTLVRALAGRPVEHPSGELRSPARSTLDEWIRAYRRGGFEALKPAERCPGPRTQAALLEQAAALRRELPARTGAQIAEILRRLHGEAAPGARTVERYEGPWVFWRLRNQAGDAWREENQRRWQPRGSIQRSCATAPSGSSSSRAVRSRTSPVTWACTGKRCAAGSARSRPTVVAGVTC